MAKVPSTVSRLAMTWPMSSSRPASVVVSAEVCSEHRRDGAALSLEHLQQLAGKGVDLVGSNARKAGGEAADERVDVKRGRRPCQWDRVLVEVSAPTPAPLRGKGNDHR